MILGRCEQAENAAIAHSVHIEQQTTTKFASVDPLHYRCIAFFLHLFLSLPRIFVAYFIARLFVRLAILLIITYYYVCRIEYSANRSTLIIYDFAHRLLVRCAAGC